MKRFPVAAPALARLRLCVSALCLFVISLAISGCGGGVASRAEHPLALTGTVHGGQQPVTGAALQLYAVGTTGDASTATPLLLVPATTSDGTGDAGNSNANAANQKNQLAAGSFTLAGAYTCPSANAQVYVVGTGGNPGLRAGKTNPALAMLAVLGRCGDLTAGTNVLINEVTTIGSLAPLAPLVPYMTGLSTLGSGTSDTSQLAAALDLVRAYTDISNGGVPGPELAAGFYASSQEIVTLADILASCVNSDGTGVCQQLFTLTTPPQGTEPTETITAALDILKYPTNNTAAIYHLIGGNGPFLAALASPPASWKLPILPIVATPVISPATGTYAVAPTITLTDSTPGATIYYTFDGSVPTSASFVYTVPFNLPGTIALSQTVRASAVAPNFAPGAGASARYTIPAAGTTTNLVFVQQPVSTQIGGTLRNFRTGFVDSYGNTIRNAYAGIYLSLQNNLTNATLGGSTGVSANSSGFADFNSITIDKLGTGYTLLATWYGNGNGPVTAVSAPFDIMQAGIILATPSPLTGAGSTQPGTFTLQKPVPAGGLTLNLSTSNASAITVAPSTVALNAGDTTGAFTYTSVGAGVATLRASAVGYLNGKVDETTTAKFVSLGMLPTLTLGSTQPLTLRLSTPAPAGGVTVNLASNNPAVASITPDAMLFAAGMTTSSTAPTVSAKMFGITRLTASAAGYAPDAKNLIFSGVATVTSTLTTTPSSSVTDTITLGQAAPTGGVTFTITSDKTSVAYPYPTTVNVPSGATSATFTVYAAAVGSTTIRVNSTGFTEATTKVSVNGTISLGASYLTQPAAKLYVPNTVILNYRPTATTSVTVTSSNPALLLLSTDPNVTGNASITMSTATTSTPVFYEQGQAGGTVNVTITAANYKTLVQPVTVNLPVLLLQSLVPNNSLSSVAPAGEIDVALGEAQSNGGFLGICSFGSSVGSNSPLGCKLNPGVNMTVDVTSSNTAVATLSTAPVTLTSGTGSAITRLQPVGAGITNISLGTLPAGFYTSAAYPFYTFSPVAFTVTQTTFMLPNTGAQTGTGVTVPLSVTTSVPDATAAGATVTVSAIAGALISTDPNVMGSASVVLKGVKSALPTLYLQGLINGQTTLTFSAPGYKTLQTPLGIGQASVIFGPGKRLGVSTTTVSTPAQIELDLIVAGFGNCFQQGISYCFLNPATSNQFNITSSNSVVGTVGTLTMAPGTGYAIGSFTGLSGGTITLTIATPPTPLVPSSSYFGTFSIAGSVSQATFRALSPVTGVNLSTPEQSQVNTAPSTPQNVSLTSSNPAIAVLSTNPATLGSATAIAKTNGGAFYVQGLSVGTTTLTMASTGYTTTSTTITVLPCGVIFGSGATFSTTAFSAVSPLSLYLVAFDATTGAVAQYCAPGYCTLNPGPGLTAIVVSSNLNTGTITTSAVTFAGGSSAPGSTGFLPNNLGQTNLSIIQPAGFINSTLGASAGVATVTGNPISRPVYGGITTGAGTFTGLQLSLDSAPPLPVTVTVSLADPSLGKLSLDPKTMGTGSTLTFPSITKLIYQSSSPDGAIPPIYVQGIKPGYTQLLMSGKGYLPSASTLLVGKVGLTLAAPSNGVNYQVSRISSTSTMSAPFGMSVLDPDSQSVIGDCGQYVANIANSLGCAINPGQAVPALRLVPDDASIGTFPSTPTPLDTTPTALFTRIPFTGMKAGFTNYNLGTPSAGYYNTTTINHRQGYAGVYSPQAQGSAFVMIAATDIDGGVGIEGPINYALSGTIPGYYNSPFTITVGDPTIAVVTQDLNVAGKASTTFTTFSFYGSGLYLQGLKAGTTTLTFTLSGYQSRTINVTVRPAGFTIKKRDLASKVLNVANFLAAPALLNDAGQWMADAIMNPQSAPVRVALVSGNPAVATVSEQYTGASYLTFTPSASSAAIYFNPVTVGSTRLWLGAVSAPFIQATTYQSVNAIVQ